jgi:hypothetical protein
MPHKLRLQKRHPQTKKKPAARSSTFNFARASQN